LRDELVLVTGGAGFIGSHLVDALLEKGCRVRVLDSLDRQVHGEGGSGPAWLSPEAELVVGDVRDPDVWARSLDGVAVVYHLAAAVGVGQSMYQIAAYTASNTQGTAHLLQTLVDRIRAFVDSSEPA
jgi:dTDP-L-rhamnose 4-epimerase